MAKIIFKSSNKDQPSLFPFNFDTLVEENHPARLIDTLIEKLDIISIINTYKGGGTSSYHPRMLLKVLIFGYLNNLFSSRKIEKALKENVYFMWLSGQSFPDFRTINNFRGQRLKGKIEDIFKQVVLILVDSGVISLKEIFTDGTKIESVANRYTFVWKGSVEKNKEKLEKKIQIILNEIDLTIKEDAQEKEEIQQTACLTSAELEAKVQEINKNLKNKDVSKPVKKKVEELQTKFLPKLREYELHLNIMGDRNSYSKTDPDATFMRMKEDHMKNGQLKPAYNIQLSTEKNFITNFSSHQNPGDTATFIPHLESFNEKYEHYPERDIADAGFGSAENYEFLDNNKIENYVKFNYFHKEQTKKFRTDISKVENLYYNDKDDYYICPMGQKMLPIGTRQRETDLGYKYEVTIYQARNCNGCPLRGACHKQKDTRKIEVNKKLNKYKQKARENLNSELGIELRRRRNSEVEQTFGQLKGNKGFKRFLLKGLPKVSIEIGLLSIAHNFQKLSKLLNECNLIIDIGEILDTFKLIFNQIWNILKKITLNRKQNYSIKIFELIPGKMKKAA